MNSKTKLITYIAVFSALAAIIMVLDFPLPFVPSFYKLDASEVIVLIAGFAFGPVPAVIIEALKVALSFLLNGTTTMGIGELANFLMGVSFVLPASIMYRRHKTKKHAVIGLLVGVICLCIVSSLLNYFVLLPIYSNVYQMPLSALVDMGRAVNPNINSLFTFILLGVIPFNIIKGTLSSILVLLIYKRITPILKK